MARKAKRSSQKASIFLGDPVIAENISTALEARGTPGRPNLARKLNISPQRG